MKYKAVRVKLHLINMVTQQDNQIRMKAFVLPDNVNSMLVHYLYTCLNVYLTSKR